MVVESSEDGDLDIKDASKKFDTDKSKALGSTVAADDDFLNVDVTIWIEGWQTFKNAEDKNVSMWDFDFIGSKFDVGFEFAVDPIIQE